MAEVYTPWKLYEKSKAVPLDKTLETKLTLEFVRNERSWAREAEIGQEAYRANLRGLPLHQALQKSLGVFVRVNDIHYPIKGRALSKVEVDAKLSSVITHMGEQVVLDHATEVSDSYLADMYNQAYILETTPGTEWNRWFAVKVRNLAVCLQIWKFMLPWIDGLKEKLGETVRGREAEVKKDADLIWDQLTGNRGYGVRNSFYLSPLFLDSQHAFFLLDESLENPDANLRRGYFIPNMVALLGIGEKPGFGKDLTPTTTKHQSGIVKYHTIDTAANHGIYPITEDGDIHTSILSNLSLREVFARREAEGVFELFRLFSFMRLYDLTTRADLVDKLPSIDKLEREVSRDRSGLLGVLGIGKKLKPFSYREILVPRTKPLEPEPEADVIKEEQNPESPKRFTDRHHVVWFIRRLPEGYHASQSAKELAKQHNVELKPDETIVRDHWRGNREPQVKRPTQAKFRR